VSTHCFIGVDNGDGTVTGVNCAYDGFLSGVGLRLLKHYSNETRARQVVAHGDLDTVESLTPRVDCQGRLNPIRFPADAWPSGSFYRYLWRDGAWLVSIMDYNTDSHIAAYTPFADYAPYCGEGDDAPGADDLIDDLVAAGFYKRNVPRAPRVDPKRGDVLWATIDDENGAAYLVHKCNGAIVDYFKITLSEEARSDDYWMTLDDFRAVFASATILRTAP